MPQRYREHMLARKSRVKELHAAAEGETLYRFEFELFATDVYVFAIL